MEYNFRKLDYMDYYREYLNLLSELTVCNYENINFKDFCDRLDLIIRSNTHIYVLEHNNKIIATGTLLIENKFIHDLSCVGHIEDVVIKKEFRGFKIGKKIIEYLTGIAKENNCYKTILDCGNHNISFYEKCNFKVNGTQMSMYFE